jgi:hypothetical protein
MHLTPGLGPVCTASCLLPAAIGLPRFRHALLADA